MGYLVLMSLRKYVHFYFCCIIISSLTFINFLQIDGNDVTYFVQGIDYGVIAAWQQQSASMLYYEYDGDG